MLVLASLCHLHANASKVEMQVCFSTYIIKHIYIKLSQSL